MPVNKVNYGEMTWPEVTEVVRENRVPLIPVATIEDHGHHLPIDTDLVLGMEIYRRVCERIPDKVVLIPPIIHGFSPHHMDFPGALTVGVHTFLDYVSDICKSLARHGFKRMLIVNSHGSNSPFVDIAARVTNVDTEARCAAVSYWNLRPVREMAARLRQSELGGMAHACELETSMYLAIRPDLVDMSKARRDMNFPRSAHFGVDLVGSDPDWVPGALMEYRSTMSETGAMGDPTLATAEKGEAFITAAVDGLVAVVEDLRQRPLRPRIDHH